MDEALFTVKEKDLAVHLGVPRETLKQLRHDFFVDGKDYILKDRAIFLSDPAAYKAARFATGEKLPEPENEKNGAPPVSLPDSARRLLPASAGAPITRIGKVQHRCKNTHIVLVKSLGELVRMKVRHNRKFVPGMEVPMKLIEEPDLYELARNMPRYVGKW